MAADVRQIITREALALGLDPRAVLAVAAGEGGFRNREGDVGDLAGGGSYGPFQLYAQGALPAKYRGNAAAADAWAWSPMGIKYALNKMVQVGAAGQKGAQAVETIIRKFERPADPNGSIRNAVGRLGQSVSDPADIKGKAAQAYQAGPAAIVNGPSPAQALLFQQQKVQSLLAMSQNTIMGNQGANWQIIQGLQQAQQQLTAANAQMMQAETEARSTGGTIAPAGGTGRTYEGVGSQQLQTILKAADAQVGKPYVFGAASPDAGFDCSGLIDWAFKQAGIDLPGRLVTGTAIKMGVSVKGKPMKPGDWMVRNGGPGGGHMAMYVGNGQAIVAPRTGERVRYQSASDFTGEGWDVRRVLK